MYQNDQAHFKNLERNTERLLKPVRSFWDIIHQSLEIFISENYFASSCFCWVIFREMLYSYSRF